MTNATKFKEEEPKVNPLSRLGTRICSKSKFHAGPCSRPSGATIEHPCRKLKVFFCQKLPFMVVLSILVGLFIAHAVLLTSPWKILASLSKAQAGVLEVGLKSQLVPQSHIFSLFFFLSLQEWWKGVCTQTNRRHWNINVCLQGNRSKLQLYYFFAYVCFWGLRSYFHHLKMEYSRFGYMLLPLFWLGWLMFHWRVLT